MTPAGLAQLQADEGLAKVRSDGMIEAYPDPLSGADPYTIGYGSTGPDITKGTVWTKAQAAMRFAERIAEIEAALADDLSWWPGLNAARQDAMTNLAFNLGVHGLLSFHDTLAAMSVRNYPLAATHLLSSKAAAQLPARYKRLANVIRAGTYP